MNESTERSIDSDEILENTPHPYYLNLTRFVGKVCLSILLFFSLMMQIHCDEQVQSMIITSATMVILETIIMSVFMVVKFRPDLCYIFSSYYIACFIILDVLFDIFYVFWSVFFTIQYFGSEKCSDSLEPLDLIALVLITYYLISMTFMFCCFCTKICIFSSGLCMLYKNYTHRLTIKPIN